MGKRFGEVELMDNGLRYRIFKHKTAATSLTPDVRSKINEALMSNGYDGNLRFRSMGEAINGIHGLLTDFSIEIADVVTASDLQPQQGHKTYNLQFITNDPMSPDEIKNAMIALSWFTHGEESYEVVAYVS